MRETGILFFLFFFYFWGRGGGSLLHPASRSLRWLSSWQHSELRQGKNVHISLAPLRALERTLNSATFFQVKLWMNKSHSRLLFIIYSSVVEPELIPHKEEIVNMTVIVSHFPFEALFFYEPQLEKLMH